MNGWDYGDDLGQLDNDGPVELMMAIQATRKLGVFDSGNGAFELNLPWFEAGQSAWTTFDTDGDGKRELFVWTGSGSHPICVQYRYDLSTGWVQVFSHNDRVNSLFLAHVRSASTYDVVELWDDDIRVRDVSTGAVVWRASTSIPGWTGASPSLQELDVDADGRAELLVRQSNGLFVLVDLFHYSAGVFSEMWGQSGWDLIDYFNSDGDPQPELVMQNFTDDHLRLVDGLTGATELDLPWTGSTTTFRSMDTNGDGRSELYLQRTNPTPLFTELRWDGASYATVFSHTDPMDEWTPLHTRSANLTEILEVDQDSDVRIRDTAGNVLFRASTAIPGWSVAGNVFWDQIDVDQNGLPELLLLDNVTTRLVRYSSGSYSQFWAIGGSTFAGSVDNADGDAQSELMFVRQSDSSYELRDGLTGAVEQSWPQFKTNHTWFSYGDFLGAGRNDLVFWQPRGVLDPSPSPRTSVHYSTVNGFVPRFDIADTTESITIVKARDATHSELMMFAADSDLVLRDPLTGTLLFRGSRDIPGWAGVSLSGDVTTMSWWSARDQRQIILKQPTGMRFVRRDVNVDVGPPGPVSALRVFSSRPNPFLLATTLRFETPRAGYATVRIYDTAGRLARDLDRSLPAGTHSIAWDGLDQRGGPAPTGVLFLEVAVDGMKQSSKLVRLH